MKIYVIQVITGREKNFITHCLKEGILPENQLIYPERVLIIRRGGFKAKEKKPVFPGYVFIRVNDLDKLLIGKLKKLQGFVHFLFDNRDIRCLPEEEEQLLMQLVSRHGSSGSTIGLSKVTFDEGGSIRVVSGPMKGHEGRIVRVDKRKGRAKVRLSLYEKSFLIDFGFEALVSPL